MMTATTHVHEYLEARIKQEDCSPETAAVFRVMIRGYRQAIRAKKWDVSHAIGGLMVEAAQGFKDDPDYPGTFARP